MFLVERSVLCLRIYTEYVLQEQKCAFLKYVTNNENSLHITWLSSRTLKVSQDLQGPMYIALGLNPGLVSQRSP